MLSLLAFDPEYIAALIEIGEHDAATQADDIRALLSPPASVKQRATYAAGEVKTTRQS